MIQYDLPYAIFASDDIRFRPRRLASVKVIVENSDDVCMFHFEGYGLVALTGQGVRKIGPMDENFWPAYAEDCDYWYRAQLVGCKMYYRGGYLPDRQSASSLSNAFADHGDVFDPKLASSGTYRSFPELEKQVQRTLDGSRGRFAYLSRKWNSNVCENYHKVINQWRETDEVLLPELVPSAWVRTCYVLFGGHFSGLSANCFWSLPRFGLRVGSGLGFINGAFYAAPRLHPPLRGGSKR